MPELSALSAFQLLRPGWLLLLPVVVLMHWQLRRATRRAEEWQQAIAPHLLAHLTVGGRRVRRFRPYQLLTVLCLMIIVALSGPTWRKELTPFTEDRAPLVIALELTPSMLAIDQPPTRLERAKQKIRDLLDLRSGARTAVVAYAGSAHAVLPLTDDPGLVTTYLDSLTPSRMPLAGDRADLALTLAESLMANESAAGTILFMTDGIDRGLAEVFADHGNTSRNQVLLLAFGTEAGGPTRPELPTDAAVLVPGTDLGGLQAIAAASNGALARATVDATDVERLMRRIRTHLTNAIDADEKLQWHDAGYYLVWPLALLMLLFFRRGWTVQWQ